MGNVAQIFESEMFADGRWLLSPVQAFRKHFVYISWSSVVKTKQLRLVSQMFMQNASNANQKLMFFLNKLCLIVLLYSCSKFALDEIDRLLLLRVLRRFDTLEEIVKKVAHVTDFIVDASPNAIILDKIDIELFIWIFISQQIMWRDRSCGNNADCLVEKYKNARPKDKSDKKFESISPHYVLLFFFTN